MASNGVPHQKPGLLMSLDHLQNSSGNVGGHRRPRRAAMETGDNGFGAGAAEYVRCPLTFHLAPFLFTRGEEGGT